MRLLGIGLRVTARGLVDNKRLINVGWRLCRCGMRGMRFWESVVGKSYTRAMNYFPPDGMQGSGGAGMLVGIREMSWSMDNVAARL